jgi:hypothetical protein
MLPSPFWPLAEHAGFGQNCSDGSIGSDVVVCIHTACREPSKCSSLSPLFHQLVWLYHETRRRFIINRAQAYKWVGEDETTRKIVNGADWSASSDKFKLGVAVLLDDFDQADYWVRKIGSQGDVRMIDYREWPLFREYRKTEGFLKAFEEVFNEPFYSEKDLFVAADWLKDAISSENSAVLHED